MKQETKLDQEIKFADYPSQTYDKLRYGDTDRQGHVNNAVFATLFETGRVEFFNSRPVQLSEHGSAFVLARLVVNFKREIHWPGTVSIGTRLVAVGRSSMTLEQALFQDDHCVAIGESVVVLMDEATRRSRPFSPAAAEHLAALRSSNVSQNDV
jgi:acyl-CoA thioester hydrolase